MHFLKIRTIGTMVDSRNGSPNSALKYNMFMGDNKKIIIKMEGEYPTAYNIV